MIRAPSEDSNYVDLIQILAADGPLSSALDAAKRATPAFPGSQRIFLLRGSIELKMSQFTDAVASYNHAVELDPASADGLLGLAEAQHAAGMTKEARAGFEIGINRFPKDARFKLQFALMLLKEAETNNSLVETRAEQLLKSALALDRSLPDAHYQLGRLAVRRGQLVEALQEFQQAARLDPKSARTHYALARLYRRLGRNEEVSRQMFRQFSTCVKQQLEVPDDPQSVDNPPQHVENPAARETKAVAAAPLAFRALWAIIVRFFRGLFGGERKKP